MGLLALLPAVEELTLVKPAVIMIIITFDMIVDPFETPSCHGEV